MENVLRRTDKVVVDSPGVLPYLKLQGGRTPPPPDDGADVQVTAPAPAGKGQ
jgi:hypothetical protein